MEARGAEDPDHVSWSSSWRRSLKLMHAKSAAEVQGRLQARTPASEPADMRAIWAFMSEVRRALRVGLHVRPPHRDNLINAR